jgi:hypothetical protein
VIFNNNDEDWLNRYNKVVDYKIHSLYVLHEHTNPAKEDLRDIKELKTYLGTILVRDLIVPHCHQSL